MTEHKFTFDGYQKLLREYAFEFGDGDLCVPCMPAVADEDVEFRYAHIVRFGTVGACIDCPWKPWNLSGLRLGWLTIQASLNPERPSKPWPGDPQQRFWPSYRPRESRQSYKVRDR